jgi:predicted metal-dependent TIM-barrel fold hydrolase
VIPQKEANVLNYIDPHIHMVSRVTDDYQRMAQCGCIAMSEPAFWAGFDRGSVAAPGRAKA